MKKGLKFYLFILISLFVLIMPVKAGEFKKGEIYTKPDKDAMSRYKGGIDELKFKGLPQDKLDSKQLSKSYKYYKYPFNNGEYWGYCIDENVNGGTKYKVDRILGDSSQSAENQAYDMGLLEIAKKGYNQDNNTYTNKDGTTISGNDLYVATELAIRAYHVGLFERGKKIDDDHVANSKAASTANLAAMWLAQNHRASIFNKDNEYNECNDKGDNENVRQCKEIWYKKRFIELYPYYKKYKKVALDWSDPKANLIVSSARDLFHEGLNMAANTYENLTSKDSKSASIDLKMNKATKVETNGNKKIITGSFTIKNFDLEKGFLKNLKFECPNCDANGITNYKLYYKVPGADYVEYTGEDILKKLASGASEYKIDVKVEFDQESKEICEDTNYKISYDYNTGGKNEAIPSGGYDKDGWMGAYLKSTKAGQQDFVIVTKNPNAGNGNPDDSDNPNNGDNPNKGGFDGTIPCEEPNKVDDTNCETELDLPICELEEGSGLTEKDLGLSKIKAPTDIKTCILNKTDDKGNSYQLTSNNGGVQNNYCSVFCKEDYDEIRFTPKVDNVICGRYFQLTSHIKGSKDCYTYGSTSDKSINKAQFIEDVKTAQKNMINSYNQYTQAILAEKAVENKENIQSKTCSCGKTYNYVKINYNGKVVANENNITGVVTVRDEYKEIDYGDSCDSICVNDTTKGLDELIKKNKEDSLNGMKTAMEDLNEYIKKYNSCTTGWTNEFLFSQEVSYYYDETHKKNDTEPYSPYYQMLEKENKEDSKKLEIDKSKEPVEDVIKVTICTGDATNEYECTSNPLNYGTDFDKQTADDYSAYNDGTLFPGFDFMTCDKNGCTSKNIKISQARFVRKRVEKEQYYINPTSFYQIEANGKISIVNYADKNQFSFEPLENKLPVSIATVGGGLFRLSLQSLGEFYDTGSVGRLIDFGGKNEKDSIAYYYNGGAGVSKNKKFNGNYVCYFESPCRPNDCPNCKFECDLEHEKCELNPNPTCPECKITCDACILNLGELELTFNTVSTSSIKKNITKREYGYNWNTSINMGKLKTVTDKANNTIEEISNINEAIYNNIYEFEKNKVIDDDSSLAFSIKMTPNMTRAIRDYNSSVENSGGYSNDSLTCYDYTTDDGKVLKNIFCYSDYLDELSANNDFKNNILFKKSRISKDGDRKNTQKSSDGYWVTYKNYIYDESVIGGPSWK